MLLLDRAGCARRPAVAGAADSPGRLPRRVGIDAYNECGKVAASQLRRLSYPLKKMSNNKKNPLR